MFLDLYMITLSLMATSLKFTVLYLPTNPLSTQVSPVFNTIIIYTQVNVL